MTISQFDYYIDKAINGDYLSQTKRISSIPEKIEENIIYYSPTFEKEVIDQNWEKLLYYFYVSCGSLLDLCILIETRCKFYDPKTYRLAKKSAVMESIEPIETAISFMEKIAIPFGEKIIDKSFQTSISNTIDSLDKWIKIGKKIRDSESMKLIKRTIQQKYQITIDTSSIDSVNDILTKVKRMRNKLISSRRIIAYYLTKESSLSKEQKDDIQKAFLKYFKKEKLILKNFFDIAMKYHK